MSSNDLSLKYWSSPNKWFLDAYNDTLLQKIIHGPLKLRVELALAATKLCSAKTFLDLGCGPSRVLYRSLKETDVTSAIGLDFSPRMLEESKRFLSKKNVLDKVQLINCDLIATPEYPKADIAIGLGLFDYISDPELVLKKAHLSSNFVVASWVRPSIRNYLRRFRYSCEIYTHTEKEVTRFFNNIGISSVSFIECGPMCGFISISSKN